MLCCVTSERRVRSFGSGLGAFLLSASVLSLASKHAVMTAHVRARFLVSLLAPDGSGAGAQPAVPADSPGPAGDNRPGRRSARAAPPLASRAWLPAASRSGT